MEFYDITQELFSCEVYPGDTPPARTDARLLARGDSCNLTDFSMGAHNGTHVDAPRHFLDDGDGIDRIPLEKLIGEALVCRFDRAVTAGDIAALPDGCQKLLIRGTGWITEESAAAAVERGIHLIGTESQSVGPAGAPKAVHLILLGAKTVILEGIRLNAVPEGKYFLFAAPLKLGGCDGAPVRAVLVRS